jgi:hypothetical protein
MELKEEEVRFILDECRRMLRSRGSIRILRNDRDPHYMNGVHKGEDMWQSPAGFVVHFLTEEKVRRLTCRYEIVHIQELDDPAMQYTR